MVKWIEPGKTIGIIGGGKHAYNYAKIAKELGYQVGILDPNSASLATASADWLIKSNYSNSEAVNELAMNSDVVIYATENFNTEIIHQLQRSVTVPQGGEISSLAYDRILQKYFFETSSINITPHAVVLTIEDIKESIDSIGYPAILKTNQVGNAMQRILIRDESEIEKAESLLETGTCVLESWVEVEHKVVVHLVKTSTGDITLYPLIEVYTDGSRKLRSASSPANISSVVEDEIYRLSRNIAESFTFVGGLSIEMYITPNNFIYVDLLSTQPHEAIVLQDRFSSLSFYEAAIRAMIGMQIPERISVLSPSIYIPFKEKDMDIISQQMQIKPDWSFYFYPEKKVADHRGYVLIPTDNVDLSLQMIEDIIF